MNKSIIRYIVGNAIRAEAILMLFPALIALYYREFSGIYYVISAAICYTIGFLLTIKKPKSFVFYLKEGCISTALTWISFSLLGTMPFLMSGEIPDFTNAMFEMVSGFTTTGATILVDIEALSNCHLIWRTFSHWIGGMGVLVFILAVLPLAGGSNINLIKAESTGPSVGKLVPRIKTTARLLYIIYIGLTVLQTVILLLGGVNWFDALNISFSTAGTGGFSNKNDSMASYSDFIQIVTTIFMMIFGINFNAYYLILLGKFRKAFGLREVRAYLLTILFAIIFVTISISKIYHNNALALHDASFQVVSIITSTGFCTTDYDAWTENAKTILVFLMFIGACAGSTGGGIKISRFMILFKTVRKEISAYLHPNSVKVIKVEGKPVEHEVVRSTNVYMITFLTIFCISWFLVSFNEKDMTTTFTSVAATINNTGPGLLGSGPTENFDHFSNFSKWVMIFNMLTGRLELFPMLMLLHPANIADFFRPSKKKK